VDVEYLLDRQAILDVVMRQARAHDRHDAALMATCFWPDGADEHGSVVTPGPEYGETANGWHAAGFLAHLHHITSHTCEIDGTTAHAESYVLGTMLPRHAPGRATITAGRYVDRLEKRAGEWRILVRRTVIDTDIEGASRWPQGELPAAFPTGARDHTDLSYARPLQIDTPTPRWDDRVR
jgi:hypothetical protein